MESPAAVTGPHATPAMTGQPYQPLSVETICERLGAIPALIQRLGADAAAWSAREVGDGNLNLVFIIEGPVGAAVVKQALPYVRLVGESWPLPLKRAYFEYEALMRQGARDPGAPPDIYYFDRGQALIAMEFLTPHVVLRRSLMAGVSHRGLGQRLGEFAARTAFRGSALSMDEPARKRDIALFADNIELCAITENLVFTDPYFDAPLNRRTSPQLDALTARLRADVDLKVEAQHLKWAFSAQAETLLHGDLHTGSIMTHGADVRFIDPEFAVYGPIGFDVGMLIGNFLMAFFAQRGHELAAGERDEYRCWILDVAEEIWRAFQSEFGRLWREERRGMLYPAALYEDQGHRLAAEQALTHRMRAILADALGFCGIEMHRRILGLAHIVEFEAIADKDVRAAAESRALLLGRHLIVNRSRIGGLGEVRDLAERIEARGER